MSACGSFLMQFLSIVFITLFPQNACSIFPKEKVAVDFDITGDFPHGIKLSQSETMLGGVYFYIKKAMVTHYRIGEIKYAGATILPGDVRDSDRFLFFVNFDGCCKYLRIVTKSIYRNGRERRVHEFVTNPGDTKFQRVVRKLVHIDVFTQKNCEIIQVEEDPEKMIKRFKIRDDMKLKYTIGAVKCGRQIINKKIEGLLSKEVVWEGGFTKPEITIISIDVDGDRGTETHEFTGDERGFISHGVWYTPVYIGPSDEQEGENAHCVSLSSLLADGADRSQVDHLTSKVHVKSTESIIRENEEKLAKRFRVGSNQDLTTSVAESLPVHSLDPSHLKGACYSEASTSGASFAGERGSLDRFYGPKLRIVEDEEEDA